MTVYVDDMRAPFRRMIMCHMIADTEEELHSMAHRIGVKRKWYQGNHYDISLTKRRLAVRFGAVEITMRQLAFMAANKKRAERGLPPLAATPSRELPAVALAKRVPCSADCGRIVLIGAFEDSLCIHCGGLAPIAQVINSRK